MDFAEALRQCRAKFGPPTRTFNWWERKCYLPCETPGWAEHDDLRTFFEQYQQVLSTGWVTWGHIVQANQSLFEKGPQDSGGEIVYSDDRGQPASPATLEKLAGALYKLRATTTGDPRLREIADHLNDGMTRVFGLAVPVSGGRSFRLSTAFIQRYHLPSAKLVSTLVPIVVSADDSGVVVPLPSKYWPKDFRTWWCDGADADTVPGPIDFRSWLTRVAGWDGVLPLFVTCVPLIAHWLFPRNDSLIAGIAVILPIIALLLRFYFGKRHIRENDCSDRMRVVQYLVFGTALLLICLLDSLFVVLLLVADKKDFATKQELLQCALLYACYFLGMVVAMFPGRPRIAATGDGQVFS